MPYLLKGSSSIRRWLKFVIRILHVNMQWTTNHYLRTGTLFCVTSCPGSLQMRADDALRKQPKQAFLGQNDRTQKMSLVRAQLRKNGSRAF